jgi:hypothetical protein
LPKAQRLPTRLLAPAEIVYNTTDEQQIPEQHAMSFDWEKIQESKRTLRRHWAARPIAEKLAMLDALRERALTLRASSRIERANCAKR